MKYEVIRAPLWWSC